MRRTLSRRSRRTRSSADWSCPLCVETLESRLALSHAPLDASPEAVMWGPTPAGSSMGHDYAEIGDAGYGPQRENESFRGNDFAFRSDDAFRSDYAAAPGRPTSEMAHGFDGASVYQISMPQQVSIVIVEFTYSPQIIFVVSPAASPSNAAPNSKPDSEYGRSSPGGDGEDGNAAGVANQVRATAAAAAGAQAARSVPSGDVGIASSIAASSNSANAPQPAPMLARADAGFGGAASGAMPTAPLESGVVPPVDSRARFTDGGLGHADAVVEAPDAQSETVARQSAEASVAAALPTHSETLFVVNDVSRAALLSNMSMNVEAVDQALEAVMREVEKIGGELVTWFDELTLPQWAFATTAAALLGYGGHCYWKRRGARLDEETGEEESSSWLFTRLHTPPGQP